MNGLYKSLPTKDKEINEKCGCVVKEPIYIRSRNKVVCIECGGEI